MWITALVLLHFCFTEVDPENKYYHKNNGATSTIVILKHVNKYNKAPL